MMARKGNPISVRLDLNRSSDSSRFSDYYYSKSVSQDVNLRSYFGSIRPPTRLTFGFRLGRCIIIHFPKRTFIHFFLPRRPRRPGKEKGRWWTFGKVGPIGCLHSSDDTEEERNEVRDRGAGKRVESTRIDDREKQNEIRIWPKKKQRYGYHDRSPSIKKNLSKSLGVRGAFKHPKYAGVVNDIAFLIENDDSFGKTKLFKLFFQKKAGKRVRCHTPCLPKVPRGRARRSRARQPGSGFPTGRGTGDGHLEAHHDLQARPARPGKATRLGVRGSIVPAASRTSYSSFLKAGGRDFFSATEKNGADLTRHNLTIYPIPITFS